LRWAIDLTTDVRENASAHGDNRSPLKVVKPFLRRTCPICVLLSSLERARLFSQAGTP